MVSIMPKIIKYVLPNTSLRFYPLRFTQSIPVVIALFYMTSTMVLWAQESTPTPAAANSVTVASISSDQVNEVARGLWCPLCSGVRLDACELKACEQMRDVIALKLSEGANASTIRDYFVDQYGPQVLGEPPREGLSWLAWILPFVALAGGGVFLWSKVRGMMRPQPVSAISLPTAESEQDEYKRKLAEELKRYG